MFRNITNMFHLCLRNEIPTMLDAGGGGIVYTASGAGLIAASFTPRPARV